jgi:uncharacterized protein YbjT (DUF2867 family)
MILVTGATGKNGVEIIKRLAGRKERVRAMVHKQDDLRQDTHTFELEYVAADFDDPASLRRVLRDVQRAFLVTNSSERVEERQLRFVALAREAGVRHVVYLSQLHASSDSPLRFLRYHAAVEEALRTSGMTYTNLRPNLYMQGLLMIGKSIASEGRFFAPAGSARVSVVDVRDIAAVAVAALTQNQHENKTYNLTGTESLTHAEMAALLSAACDRPIEFVNVPEQEFRAALRSLQMPDWQADGLIEDYAHYRRGEASAVSSAIGEIIGKPARPFSTFAHDYRAAFLGENTEKATGPHVALHN